MIRLYTDGACSGNPGPGGWAYLLKVGAMVMARAAGADLWTTNNRMELMGAIKGLEAIDEADVDQLVIHLITDSGYVAKGITTWLTSWKKNGYLRGRGSKLEVVKNADLWKRLDVQLQRHEVQVAQIRGHMGQPENEECDKMAVAAYRALKESA